MAHPEIDRIDAQGSGNGVHLRIIGPYNLGNTESAERSGRWFVGVDTVGVDPHIGDSVGTGRGVAGFVDYPGTDLCVSPRIKVDLTFTGADGAVLDSCLDFGDDPMFRNGLELLFPGQGIAHRSSCGQGEQGNERLQLCVQLGAVTTAKVRNPHPHTIHGYAEGGGKLRPDKRGGLGGRPYVDLFVLVHIDKSDMGLHGHVLGRR